MIVRIAAIEQNGLLDQTLSGHLDHKIDIVLRAANADGDVVNASYWIVHGGNLRRE
jgi:hypothetical protein